MFRDSQGIEQTPPYRKEDVNIRVASAQHPRSREAGCSLADESECPEVTLIANEIETHFDQLWWEV